MLVGESWRGSDMRISLSMIAASRGIGAWRSGSRYRTDLWPLLDFDAKLSDNWLTIAIDKESDPPEARSAASKVK